MEKDRYDKAPARLHTPAFHSKNLTGTGKLRFLQRAAFSAVRCMGGREVYGAGPENQSGGCSPQVQILPHALVAG